MRLNFLKTILRIEKKRVYIFYFVLHNSCMGGTQFVGSNSSVFLDGGFVIGFNPTLYTLLDNAPNYRNLYNRSLHPNRSPSLLEATGKVTKKLKPLYLALIKASSLFYKTYQCLQKIITSKAYTIEIRVTLFLRLQILYSLILYKRSKKISLNTAILE